MDPSVRASLGEIRDDSSYVMPVFMKVTGQGRKGIAAAKKAGLKVSHQGRFAYVLGRHWNEFLASKAEATT